MTPFTCQYRLESAGIPPEAGECSVRIESPGMEVTPRGGVSIPVRFAEIAAWRAEDYRIRFTLEDGSVLELSMLARRYDECADLFRTVRREHFLSSLLLEEKGETAIETGAFGRKGQAGDGAGGPCTVHLQTTSLACFPDVERPFLVPYGSVTGLRDEPDLYGVTLLRDDGEELLLNRFGKRTDALKSGLEERRASLARRQGAAIAALVPDLGAMALRRGAELLRDGVPAERATLEQAAPGLWEGLWEFGFNEERREYAEALLHRSARSFAAIKETGTWGAPEGTPEALADRKLLYLFEIGRALVVEAPSSEDTATYVFQIEGETASFARSLCRALASVHFRREPVYLPLSAMKAPPLDRYTEAVRILPELKMARASFVGRAIHNSVSAWSREIEELVPGKR